LYLDVARLTARGKALLAKAAGAKLLRAARVRTDTTVIPANVAYPTDSGLLARAVGKLTRTVQRVQAAGGAAGTSFAGRRLAAARRVREIAVRLRTRGKLSREETTKVIRRVTGELASLAEKAAAQAMAVLRNGRRALPRALSGRIRGRLRRALDELAVTVGRTAAVIAHTRARLAGQMPESATRLVSLHDPDARPIRKGRIDRPVEFGYKAQVTDNDDGIVLDYSVEYGAAPDGPQLAPAVERVARRAGRVPRAVTADCGYGQAAVEGELHELGVRTVAIPRQAATSPARKAVEHGRGFRQLVKWRTGCEGRISYLKRRYGWDRTLLDGRNGAAIWCGHGVFAHNLVKISALAA
jgi:IS5 family transposase